MATQKLLGIGLYTIPEAARLLRIAPAKVRRWAQGYKFHSHSGERVSDPLIHRELGSLTGDPILSFQDLVELYIINLLRDQDVSMATIRAAAATAAHLLGTDHPFAVRSLLTDGKSIFASIEPGLIEGVSPHRALIELNKSQHVIAEAAQPFLRNLDYDEGIARRWWPMGREGRIVVDPCRNFGKPIDAPSGVPTFVLYQMHEAGEEAERIARWYGVDVGAVKSAVRYEESLKLAA